MDNDEINKLFSDSVSDITPISEYSSDYLEQSKHLRNEKNINGNPSKVEKNSPVKNINNKIQNEEDNNTDNSLSDIEAELNCTTPEIIERKVEIQENNNNNVIMKSNQPSTPNLNNNSFYDSVISISSDFSPEKITEDGINNENHKREPLESSSGLIKKLKNEENMYIEILVNNNINNKVVVTNNHGNNVLATTSSFSSDTQNLSESTEPKKVVKKRGRPRKKKKTEPSTTTANENSQKTKSKRKETKIRHPPPPQSTPKKEISFQSFMDDDDDDNNLIPTAEELFDKSFNEYSQKSKSNEDNVENVKNQNPFDIIDSIFSSSDDEDIFIDRTLNIPGEGVLAYYKYDRRYHPAKILSYVRKTKMYKLQFWTKYILTLKRNQFYTKYQPEFLTVELGEQRSENDGFEQSYLSDEELNNYIQEFIPKVNEFLEKYSKRYKDFINVELNSVKTYKELIKDSFLGFLTNTQIEYTIDQFKLALVKKTLVLKDLPMTININEDKLMKIPEDSSETNNNNNNNNDNNNNNSSNNDSNDNKEHITSSGHITRRMKKKVFQEILTDSQKTNGSDSIMSSLCVNEMSYIDKLCRYVLLPEFSIWTYMEREKKDYETSEQLCRDYEKSYDWVTEILHYRETFASGRYFIKEQQKA